MPFFFKPCFKLRRNKKKKTKNPIEITSDIATLNEIMSNKNSTPIQDETVNDSNDPINHSDTSDASSDIINEWCNLTKDKEDDFCHDTESQNSKNCLEDDKGECSSMSILETNTFALSKLFKDIDEYSTNPVITVNDVNKLFEPTQDVNNSTITITEVLQVSDTNDFSENILIQKSYEIIREITINSDVFKAIEMLQALDKNQQKLHPEIIKEKLDKHIKYIEFGDARPEKENSDDNIKTNLKQSQIDVGYENPTSVHDNYTPQMSGDSRKNETFPMKNIKNSSCNYQDYTDNSLTKSVETTENDTSSAFCESKLDIPSSKNCYKDGIEIPKIDAELENKEIGSHITNSEMCLERKENQIMANKMPSKADLHNTEYKNENKVQTNEEIENSKESTAYSCNVVLKPRKCQPKIDDECKILQNETNFENKLKNIDDVNDDDTFQFEYNADDFQNESECKEETFKNFTDIKSELECEIYNLDDKIIDTFYFTVSEDECKLETSIDLKGESDLNDNQISDATTVNILTSDKKTVFMDTLEAITNNNIDVTSKSEKLSVDLHEDGSLNTYERLSDFYPKVSTIEKCTIDGKCDKDNILPFLKTKELHSENEYFLPSVSDVITINDDICFTHDIRDSCRINDETSENIFEFENHIDTRVHKCDSFSIEMKKQNIYEIEDKKDKCVERRNHSNHTEECNMDNFPKDCIDNSDSEELAKAAPNICNLNFKNCLKFKDFDLKSDINYPNNTLSATKEAENLRDKFYELREENNMLKRQLKNCSLEKENHTDSTNNDNIKITTNFANNRNCGCNPDRVIYSETESIYDSRTTLDKTETLSDSAINIQANMSNSNCHINDFKMKDDIHTISNSSTETLPINVEFCEDDNKFLAESEIDKYESEISQDIISRSSSQEIMEYKENHENDSSANSKKLHFSNELNEAKSLNAILETSNLNRETDNSTISDMMQKHKTHFMLEGNKKMKPISKYQLCDCSNSDESSKLSEKEDLNSQKLASNGSRSFLCFAMGDSGPEENFTFDISTLKNCNDNIKITEARNKLNRTPISRKKRRPKKQKKPKIKLSMKGKNSDYTNSKINSSCNIVKDISDTTEIQFINEDPIKLLTYYKQHKKASRLNKRNKGKQYKLQNAIGIPFCENDTDPIENKRKEIINLFNKRKLRILGQMGSSLRIIPIEKVDKFKIKPCKIEKVSSNIEFKSPKKKHLQTIHSPEVKKLPKYYKDIVFDMPEKSLINKNEATNEDYPVQNELLCSAEDDGGSENMTPIRRNILDSSRLIRSPKYPSPLTREVTGHKKGNIKTFLTKSPQKNVIDHGQNHNYELLDVYKMYSRNNRNFNNSSLTPKMQSHNTKMPPQRHIQHISKYRSLSPDDLRLKFDDIFKRYAGKGRCNGDLISHKRSTEWLRDAGIIGNDLTTDEATDAFKIAAGAKVALNKRDYRIFLRKLARVKTRNYTEMYEKLCEASRRWIEW